MNNKKVLIVGAGLSGICLAHHFIRFGVKPLVLDDGKNASSIIAAGLVNPISFRRTLLSWEANTFLPFAKEFYGDLEKEVSSKFLNDIIVRRIFPSDEERNTWVEKQPKKEFKALLKELSKEDNETPFGKNGSGRVDGSFWIDAVNFMNSNHFYLKEKAILQIEPFNYDELNPMNCEYQNVKYDAIIFCTGYRNFENPYFDNIPVESTKGQVLTVQWDQNNKMESLHKKCFALPIQKHIYKIGATYEWKNKSLEITKKAKDELLENFSRISSDPIKLIDQQTGIRPTSPDRRPFIGKHSEFQKLFIFNGLGAKGYLLAPLLSLKLTEHILQEKGLPDEVNAYRFNS